MFLVTRGSSETGDLITDITGQSLSISLCGKTGKVHSGAMSAATYIQCRTRETLEKAAELYPGWPLLIAGHSLGGEHNFAQMQSLSMNKTPKYFYLDSELSGTLVMGILLSCGWCRL